MPILYDPRFPTSSTFEVYNTMQFLRICVCLLGAMAAGCSGLVSLTDWSTAEPEVPELEQVGELKIYQLGATGIAFSPVGKYMATIENNIRPAGYRMSPWPTGNWIRVWYAANTPDSPFDFDHVGEIASIRPADGASSLHFTEDGKQLVFVTSEGVEYWDFLDHSTSKTIEEKDVRLEISADGRLLARINEGKIEVIDVQSNAIVGTIETGDIGSGPVAFTPDGLVMVVCTFKVGSQTELNVWNIQSGRHLTELASGSVTPYGPWLTFSQGLSSDSRFIAGSESENRIVILNLSTGQRHAVLGTHPGPTIYSVKFSKDGRLVASVAEGETGVS